MPPQPQDEWTFLRPEEFADDDAVERVNAALDASPEEAAVHELDLDDAPAPREVLDPGETLARIESDSAFDRYFDDEQPDGARPVPRVESDAEPRVDELLASQHYSFEPDGS